MNDTFRASVNAGGRRALARAWAAFPCAGLLVLAVTAIGTIGCAEPVAPADMIVVGGGVHTMDVGATTAQAVAIRDGVIVYVGDEPGARALIGVDTATLDLVGGALLPGFQDAHVHPLSGGVELGECDLNSAGSVAEISARVATCNERVGEGEWLRGGGFQLPLFPDGNPTAAMLEAIAPGRRVYLTSADGHSAWVSRAALAAAGIDATTPDPPAGRIERDAAGRPSGTLRETASALVGNLLPPHGHEELVAGLRRGLEIAAGFGITALQEASAGPAAVAAYADLARRGELRLRVSISLAHDPARGIGHVDELVELRERYDGAGMRVNTVKLFADGVIEGGTAALLEPYLDRPGSYGDPTYTRDELREIVTALDAEGFQVHVHAIGDAAVRWALDAFEHARSVNGARDARHHLAHAQLVDPADQPRFAALGVIATFSPLWFWADTYITDLTEPRLGTARSRWLYPLASMLAAGAPVAFGSDWSVSSMDPLQGIEVGVTRCDNDIDEACEGWIPEQRVSLQAMLAGYTRGSAYANFLDTVSGTIEVGKAADLIVLDRDPFTLPPAQIGTARVILTMVAGEVIYTTE